MSRVLKRLQRRPSHDSFGTQNTGPCVHSALQGAPGTPCIHACISSTGGNLRLKWGTLGSNRLTCPRGQMGTKPAKVAHRPSWPTKAAKVCRFCATKTSPPPGLRSAGGPKLLKWGLPRARVKSAKVRPTPYVYYPRVSHCIRGCSSLQPHPHLWAQERQDQTPPRTASDSLCQCIAPILPVVPAADSHHLACQ